MCLMHDMSCWMGVERENHELRNEKITINLHEEHLFDNLAC